jgi:hypothetical protein
MENNNVLNLINKIEANITKLESSMFGIVSEIRSMKKSLWSKWHLIALYLIIFVLSMITIKFSMKNRSLDIWQTHDDVRLQLLQEIRRAEHVKEYLREYLKDCYRLNIIEDEECDNECDKKCNVEK